MHLDEVPLPELAPDEALIATMASSINFNTVWSAIFEPVPTFAFLRRFGKVRGAWGKRHDQPFHVVGSDACGVVLRVGSNVSRWKPGDRVLVHPNDVALEDPQGHDDAIQDPDQRVWGFESNYGGLGEVCIAHGDQLMPKPEHLTWEEAASMPLTNCTAYRMLVSPNGANMQQGDVVPDLGRRRRARRLRHAVRAERRRHPRLRRLEPREGREVPRGGRGARARPARARLHVLEPGDGQAGPEGAAAARQGDPRADRRPRRRHRLRAPGPRHVRRLGLRDPARRQDRHVRLHHRLHARVRQPLPVDVHEDDRRLAPRELRGGLARQRALPRGADAPDHLARATRSPRPAGPRTTSTRTSTSARSACSAWRPEEGLGVLDDELRAKHLAAITRFRPRS